MRNPFRGDYSFASHERGIESARVDNVLQRGFGCERTSILDLWMEGSWIPSRGNVAGAHGPHSRKLESLGFPCCPRPWKQPPARGGGYLG